MRNDISSIIIGLYCTTLAKIDNFSIILWLAASGEIEWSQIEEVCRRDVNVSKGWTGLWLILLKCSQNSVKHIYTMELFAEYLTGLWIRLYTALSLSTWNFSLKESLVYLHNLLLQYSKANKRPLLLQIIMVRNASC